MDDISKKKFDKIKTFIKCISLIVFYIIILKITYKLLGSSIFGQF